MKQTFLLILSIFILSSCSSLNINSQTYNKTVTAEHLTDKDTINNNTKSFAENNKESLDNDNEEIASNNDDTINTLNNTNNSSDKISSIFFGSIGFIIDDDEEEPEEEEEIKEKIVYKLASPNYFSSGRNAPNTDPVCQAYVDALNSYPLLDFFEAPMQPNTTIFSYPKWEQFDIYEYKDMYLRAADTHYYDFETFTRLRAKIEKDHIMGDNSYQESNRRSNQMYYARADINNDNVTDDIIRIDSGRYVKNNLKLSSKLIVFKGYPEKSFKDIYDDLSKNINSQYINNFFFYKGETYIKEITYDIFYDEFYYMRIQKFNDKNELITLCLIVKGDSNAKSQTN